MDETKGDGGPSVARSQLSRWALGAVLAVGALALLLKPGGASKVLGLVLAGAAVTTFARRSRTDAAVIAVVLGAVALFFLGAFLSGNGDVILDLYRR